MLRLRFSTISIISTFLLMLTVDTAMAARRSVVMLGNVRQWVDFTYSLNASEHETSSVTQHYFTEKYNISLDYAVASPRILNGTLALGLEADQYTSSGNGTTRKDGATYGLQYHIKGAILDKSPIPLHVTLQSEIQEVQRSYGSNYRLYYDSYGVAWSINNKFVPVSVFFLRSDSTTEGLPDDREAVHDEVGIHAKHFYNISQTNLDIIARRDRYTFKDSGASEASRSYEFKLQNYLHWEDRGKSRDLNSYVTLKEDAGINETKTLSVSESFVWDLGKALRSGALYNLNRQESFQGEQYTNAGSIWLQHRLYKSLTTNLQGNVRRLDLNDGSETEWGGRFSLVYQKLLPQESIMTLQGYRQYSHTDRSLGDSRLSVLDEPHQVLFGQNIPLNNSVFIPGTIVVRNGNQAVRPLPYQEGTDYRVVMVGALAEIVVSGSGLSGLIVDDSLLPNGDRVLISYEYLTPSDIRFETNSYGAAGDLSYRNGFVRLYTRYDNYSQDALSNEAAAIGAGLQWQKIYVAGAESRLNRFFNVTARYSKTDGVYQQYQYVDNSINYNDTWGDASITLFLKNSYHWYDPVNGIARDDEDILSAGGTYRRPSFLAGNFTLTSSYERYMSSSTTDRLSVAAQFNWTFRKMVLAINSRVGVTRVEDSVSHAEHLRVHLIRYF